jgi:protein-tyrosine phosphatase
MKVRVYEVERDGPGRIATMARPRGGDWLPDEMAALAAAGVQVLVSALCDDEMERLDLTGLPAAAAGAGLELVRFPIVDHTAPEPADLPAAVALADRLAGDLRAGRFVVTQCLAGIGRSSLLAGATLVRLGVSPADAWGLIRRARGYPVPDSPDQEAWLYTVPDGRAW